MPLQATSGAASYDAFGGGVAAVPNYIEDVFSTWLFNGNDPTGQAINNGVDISTYGGMAWIKARSQAYGHRIFNTSRGMGANFLDSSSNAAQNGYSSLSGYVNATPSGFTLGANAGGIECNNSGVTFSSWTFRQQPKFYCEVVGTCDSSGNITVNHTLGSAPGFAIVKRVDGLSAWLAYHRSLGDQGYVYLNATNAAGTLPSPYGFASTSTTFTANLGFAAGAQVIICMWAHNAGGFGLTGTDNVISCGSFTTDGSGNATVNLGYEPQWVMIKRTDSTSQWFMQDTMRGFTANVNNSVRNLYANLANAEAEANGIGLTSTGFVAQGQLGSGATWIYIAIRRGPMKVPTSGTNVYAPVTYTGAGGTPQVLTTNFPIDTAIIDWRSGGTNDNDNAMFSRLSGDFINTINTGTSETFSANAGMDSNEGFRLKSSPWNGSEQLRVLWAMRRAPQVHSQVCYTGNDITTGRALEHDLTIAPEMIIIVPRNVSGSKQMFWQPLGTNFVLTLNANQAANGPRTDFWGAMSATTFTLMGAVNSSGTNYQAFLWASCPGISKIGSYTGNGSSQNINCGFTSGARFVMIRRTDVGSNQGVTTSNFYVWDTARGIVSAGDPRLILNSPEGGVFQEQSDDSIDPLSSGFAVNQISATNINVSGGNYVYLAYA